MPTNHIPKRPTTRMFNGYSSLWFLRPDKFFLLCARIYSQALLHTGPPTTWLARLRLMHYLLFHCITFGKLPYKRIYSVLSEQGAIHRLVVNSVLGPLQITAGLILNIQATPYSSASLASGQPKQQEKQRRGGGKKLLGNYGVQTTIMAETNFLA